MALTKVSASMSDNNVGSKSELMAEIVGVNPVWVSTGLTSVTLTAGEVPTLIANLSKLNSSDSFTVNFPSGTFTTSSGSIMDIGPNLHNVTLKGAAPVETTLTSVASVSGSTHAYTVTYNVASSTGMSVGDYVQMYNIGPLPILSGDNGYAATLRGTPIPGEIFAPVSPAGALTATKGASTATVSGITGAEDISDYVAVGDLVTFKGQSRPVSGRTGSTITVTGTWAASCSGERAWWVTKASDGTAGTSGSSTTVTLTSGAATTQANVGDLFLADGEVREITVVGGDTDITVDEAITVSASTVYSIISVAALHWGTHKITAVASGTTIAVTNRSKYSPPINQVQLGEVNCLKTIFKNSGNAAEDDGIVFKTAGAIQEIDNIAVVGSRGSTGTYGLKIGDDLEAGVFGSNFQRHGQASCILGPRMGVADWGVGVLVAFNSTLDARRISVSGCIGAGGIWVIEGASANLRRVTNTGNTTHGMLVNSGASVVCTEGVFAGNGGDGVRRLNGASLYAEAPTFWHNAVMNIRVTGGGGLHINEGIAGKAVASNYYFDGSGGMMFSCISLASKREGIEIIGGGKVYAGSSWISGTSNSAGGGNGVDITEGDIDLTSAGMKGNQGKDIFGARKSVAVASSCNIETAIVTDGAYIDIEGADNTVTLTQTLNEVDAQGSVIKDGSNQTNGMGTTVLTVADATNTLALTAATHANRTVIVMDATLAVTLPEATGTGDSYKVVQGIAATSSTFVTADTTNAGFRGMLNAFDSDNESTLSSWPASPAGTDDTITFNGVSTGGKIYDHLEFIDIATDVWLVSGQITQSGGSEATPFSAAA